MHSTSKLHVSLRSECTSRRPSNDFVEESSSIELWVQGLWRCRIFPSVSPFCCQYRPCDIAPRPRLIEESLSWPPAPISHEEVTVLRTFTLHSAGVLRFICLRRVLTADDRLMNAGSGRWVRCICKNNYQVKPSDIASGLEDDFRFLKQSLSLLRVHFTP